MLDILASADAAVAVEAASAAVEHAAANSAIAGSIASAFGTLGGAIGVGLIGMKACESVGRNPGSSGKVLIQSIIAMGLAEGIAILALFFG